MKKMLKKSKGFTLVELLIVIIIIGILAGMMMLASGSATDKANATKLVSNLRNVKAATIMYYADHNEWPAVGSEVIKSDDICKYLDSSKDLTNYKYATNDNKFCISVTSVDTNIGKICKAMAEKSSISVDSGNTTVYMPIH